MYIDLLIRIKNGQQAKKKAVKMPFSKMDLEVAELLAKHEYISGAAKKGRMPKRMIEATLRYDEGGTGAIHGVKFLSRPSRRLYSGYRGLKSIKQGYGLSVMSTPKGIMTSDEAKKRKLGGQLLFEIW